MHGVHATFFQLGGDAPPYSPNLAHIGGLQNVVQILSRQAREVAHLREFLWVSAGFAFCGLSDVIGQ